MAQVESSSKALPQVAEESQRNRAMPFLGQPQEWSLYLLQSVRKVTGLKNKGMFLLLLREHICSIPKKTPLPPPRKNIK